MSNPVGIKWDKETGSVVIRWSCGCLTNAGHVADYRLIPSVVDVLKNSHEHGASVVAHEVNRD